MKKQVILGCLKQLPVLLLLILYLFRPLSGHGQTGDTGKPRMVSYVDHSLDNSQKYVLYVDGKPFYMINTQVRFDLLRYSEKWSAKAREALVAQAAADGFNTLSIPVHWYEVEPEKDRFDWTILDEYLSLVNKYNLKMELLWFGTNSGSHVQWLSRAKTNPNHLRTPDYVLYSPEPGSKQTTSDYNIRRDMSDYSVDLADGRLRKRETYVLARVMEHLAGWDKANDSKHPVIGVQIGNEVLGFGLPYSNSLVISYLSDVASAVKQSDYVVWTRINCVFWDIPTRIYENEDLRASTQGTNIDFVGIDTYRHHFRSDAQFVESMRTNLPYIGKNYRMVTETNSNVVYAAQMHLAALSGNNAFDFYSIESFYGRDGQGVKPLVNYLDDVRLVNKILGSAIVDIARNAHGYGLFVHNWEGVNSSPTTSPAGVTFTPNYPTAQGISILRNDNELVIMSTKGGRFSFPDSLKFINISKGYFNADNEWVKKEEASFEKIQAFDSKASRHASITLEAGMTVRLVMEQQGNGKQKTYRTYQAEFAKLGGGAATEADIRNIGFAGNGYVPFQSSGGYYLTWTDIDGQRGGGRTIKLRYSYAGERPAKCVLTVNGKEELIQLDPTGAADKYKLFTTRVLLNRGTNNTIRLESVDNHYRLDGIVHYQSVSAIDELQVF
ncbi:DUF4978 domain-containing protein [Olivibacter jilunii]|uniref:DUF4978 domain-containing protein n=1 Tax=Olivibacter jilunii TaxID=985016 RepID=UPI003F15ED40